MPRSCTICGHTDRDAIEDAFIAGTPKRRIASHYGVSERAVRYHLREHLPSLLALARDAERAARADTLLDRVEALQSRTLAILEATEETEDHRIALAAIREARSNLELIGEVTKELDRTPTLNLHLNPEWIELRTVIVSALEPHSEARDSVLRAIGGRAMVVVRDDLRLALDRVAYAEELGIVPDPWQRDLLRSGADRVLLNCCRQAGKSSMSALLGLHRAIYHPGSLILCLAPSERQAKELFGKVTDFYRELHGVTPAQSDRKLGMHLANGSRIEALPGSERTIRGFSGVDLLLVDEASRVADELVFAVRPMLAASGGRLVLLTTPYGRRGVFFEEWTEGAGWERFEITVEDVPRISSAFIKEERRALPARIFRQEYECSFEDVEDAVFAFDDVQAAISEEVTPLFGVANG